MILKEYYKVFYTSSGPKRPLAKASFKKSVEDIVYEWEHNREEMKKMESQWHILYSLKYIDEELFEQEYKGRDISFSSDMKYCVVRRKEIPYGKVREQYEMEILALSRERVLPPKDESFINKLKEYRKRDCVSQLSIDMAGLKAIDAVNDCFVMCQTDCEYVPELWTIDLGPLQEATDSTLAYLSQTTSYGSIDSRISYAIMVALYKSNSVDEAIKLASSVFKNCSRVRQLSEEELLSYNVDLKACHEQLSYYYIGEKAGFFFVTYKFSVTRVTRDPMRLDSLMADISYEAYASALYSNSGGYYGCGGVNK